MKTITNYTNFSRTSSSRFAKSSSFSNLHHRRLLTLSISIGFSNSLATNLLSNSKYSCSTCSWSPFCWKNTNNNNNKKGYYSPITTSIVSVFPRQQNIYSKLNTIGLLHFWNQSLKKFCFPSTALVYRWFLSAKRIVKNYLKKLYHVAKNRPS